MNLKQLIKCLKAFECEAIRNKPVVHRFTTSNLYGYIEEINDVSYDTKNNLIILHTAEPKENIWDSKTDIKIDKSKEI